MPSILILTDPDTGLINCKIVPKNNLMEEFLESEIQEDIAFVEYLRKAIEELDENGFEINGNAHCLRLTTTDYSVSRLHENVDDVSSGRLDDFTYFLVEWEKALRKG